MNAIQPELIVALLTFGVSASSHKVGRVTHSHLFAAMATTVCLLVGLLLWQAVVAALRRRALEKRAKMIRWAYEQTKEVRPLD